jgi:hypothetical protein
MDWKTDSHIERQGMGLYWAELRDLKILHIIIRAHLQANQFCLSDAHYKSLTGMSCKI